MATLKMETVSYSEMKLVHLSTWHQIPEDWELTQNNLNNKKLRRFIKLTYFVYPITRKTRELQFGVTVANVTTEFL
jgi:hypothetical protein